MTTTEPSDAPPPDPSPGLPNVRVHLRGGQTIETRCGNISTRRGSDGNGLVGFTRESTEPGWPSLHYVRLDAVDAIEWLAHR